MKPVHPPRWADRFLMWYCRPEVLEEIQGDAYELHQRNLKTRGRRRADMLFVWNVLRFFRWSNIRRTKKQNQVALPYELFKSYFTTGFRNILRNFVPSAINLVGLSIALGCAITCFILIDSYYDLDTMHENKDRIFLVTDEVKSSDEIQQWANSPYRLGPAMLQENPSVEKVVRIELQRGVNVRYKDDVFSERVWFVDRDFMDVFSFPVQFGNKHALRDKKQIIITAPMAEKYFGTDDPIGKVMSLKFGQDIREDFVVGAVVEKISDNSSMFFNFLISIEKMEDMKLLDTDSWKTFVNATFVLMHPGHNPSEILSSLEPHKKLQNEANVTWPIQSFGFIALPEVAKRSYELENSLSWSNHPSAMIALGVIAVLLILLACFNYMNVAVASVSTRLKEIGIRKVTGGGKSDIIFQFLTENLILCALSIAAGTLFAYVFLVPAFNSMYSVHIPFTFSSVSTLLLFFGGLLLMVSLISGAYPSIYVSSFNAVSILKGKEKFGNKSRLSRILLSLQFTIAFTTIIACLVFASSSNYFESLDWGYSHTDNVTIPVQTNNQFQLLKDKVVSNRHTLRFAGTANNIGNSSETATIKFGNENLNIEQFKIGFDYVETMGLKIKMGRSFDRTIESDRRESVIVNESLVKRMGWTSPLNQTIEIQGVKRFVVGVVSDFHHEGFYSKIDPMALVICDEAQFKYLVVNTEPGQAAEIYTLLKNEWKQIAPDDPFRGYPQDEVFKSMYKSNQSSNKILYFVSGVALVLSCMGLYGLISYNLTRRLKEFSVRKIFGANLLSIFKLMNRDYMWIVLLAFCLGAPLGFFLMNQMLYSIYPYPIPLSAWPFFVTIGLMILTVALTISTQLNRISKENPTKTLRSE